MFFPTAAHLDQDQRTWIVPIHGVVYEPEQASTGRNAFAVAVRETLRVQPDTPEAEILDQRVRYFLVDHERGKRIVVHIGSDHFAMDRSEANGHFRGVVRLTEAALRAAADAASNTLSVRAAVREGDDRQMAGVVHVVGPRGCSVISDIDDTIKHTQVNDREAVLANTFLRPFRPVAGMPELYRQCAEAGAAFHYVSGSPWQLYVPLAEFLRAEGLPSGSVHLRHFRLQDPSTTLAMLQQTQQATKLEAIMPILQAYRQRRFILIGDSGEQDPEIYTAVAGEFAEQVAAIWIRNVTGEELTNARFQPLRDKLADVPLVLFDHPDQVRPLLGGLLRQTPGG